MMTLGKFTEEHAPEDCDTELAAVEELEGWVVQDPTGGTWVPSEVAQALIGECEDPAAYAVALCEEQPMAGEWRQ